MSDNYYFQLVKLTQKYLGSSAQVFVHRVLARLGITTSYLNKDHVSLFSMEVNIALGGALSPKQKEKYKNEILALIAK